MIVFDVDGVIVPRGTIISQEGPKTTIYIKKIEKHMIDLISDLHNLGYHVNISSGRSLSTLMEMFRPILPLVSITHENGSATWIAGKIYQHVNSFKELKDLHTQLSAVKHYLIKGFEQKEHIITIHCRDRVPEIEEIIWKHNGRSDIYNKITCLWNGEAYDIQIESLQNKGAAVSEVHRIGLFDCKTIGIGDNYNDEELIHACDIGVTADASRVSGDFEAKEVAIQYEKEGKVSCRTIKLPGEVLAEQILKIHPAKL
jgi:HAD superfamily hydrolase (TIGR01484 family)